MLCPENYYCKFCAHKIVKKNKNETTINFYLFLGSPNLVLPGIADNIERILNREHLAWFMQRAKEVSIFNRTRLSLDAVNPEAPQLINATAAISNNRQSRPFAFKCPLCSLVYRTQAFLNEHMRKEHSVLI